MSLTLFPSPSPSAPSLGGSPRRANRLRYSFHHGRRIAAHPRDDTRGRYTTTPVHMPKAHQHHLEWTPYRFDKLHSLKLPAMFLADVGAWCAGCGFSQCGRRASGVL